MNRVFNGEQILKPSASQSVPVRDEIVLKKVEWLLRDYDNLRNECFDNIKRAKYLDELTRVILLGDVPLEDILDILQRFISGDSLNDERDPWTTFGGVVMNSL